MSLFYFLYIAALVAFLVFPVLLLYVKHKLGSRVRWWLIILAVPLLSWLCINAIVVFYYEYLGELIELDPSPSLALVDEWSADGAKRVFALFFGWLPGIIYAAPYFLIWAVIKRLPKFK